MPSHAYAGYAYSMGGEFHSGNDVTSAANYWSLCGYTSYYTTNPTYSYVSSANRLNSDVLYFSAHGSRTGITFENGVRLTTGSNNGSSVVGLSSYTLSNTRLVVYDSCEGASGTTNICTVTRNRGADAVIGWQESILASDAFKWQKRFQDYCARGYKVHLAMDYADSFSDYDDNSTIKSHLIYGNWTQVIKRTSASSANILSSENVVSDNQETNRAFDINKIECDYDSINYSVIENTIKKHSNNFIKSKYEIFVTPTNPEKTSYVVDYLEKSGDFITSNGYTLIFKDNVAYTIYDNTTDNEEIATIQEIKAPSIEELDKKEALAQAKEKVLEIDDKNIIINQEIKPYYDTNNGKYYLKIFSEYYYKGTTDKGANSYLYLLK